MSLAETVSFVQSRRQGAEDERLRFESGRLRFADQVDATRTIWDDGAARSLFADHIEPFGERLAGVRDALARSEEAQSSALSHINRAIAGTEAALVDAATGARTAAAAESTAARAVARAQESLNAASDVQSQVSNVRATLAGLAT
jgi:hypothetical protein